MSVAKLQTEDPVAELSRLRARLKRLHDYAAPSTFSNATSALLACRNELKLVLPLLIAHFTHEAALLSAFGLDEPEKGRLESSLAENQSRVRELRAVLESADLVVEESVSGRDSSAIARGLCAYLAACVADVVRHEENDCPLRLSHPRGVAGRAS